jgi:hypothetical protein
MIPLTDFFSNPVQIRFPGTNTLRERALNNRAYNLNYFIFVPTTNTATLRPYLSSGYPYPGAANVPLESGVSFTIANRQTAVNPATIQLFLNSSNITGSISLSNNAAGSVVTYAPSSFLPPNTNNTLSVVFTDNDGSPVTITNTWQFTTADSTYTILPPADAQPIGSVTASGFAGRIYKIEDAAPNGVSLAFAELELAGLVTNTSTSQPYPNLANGGPNADGAFIETNILNYDITGLPTGAAAFPFKSGFPYVPTNTLNNNIALETLMYLQLTNGNYILTVRSDDGFRLTEGIAHTNRILGQFDGGRGNGTPTTMYITVLTNGLYPMRLLYFQAGSGGNLEFYTVNNGTPILVNDLTNSVAVKSFRTGATAPLAVTLLNPARAGSTMTFNFLSQAGHTHYVEYTGALNDAVWATLTTIIGNGSITNVVDAIGGTNRFYRVRTQ